VAEEIQNFPVCNFPSVGKEENPPKKRKRGKKREPLKLGCRYCGLILEYEEIDIDETEEYRCPLCGSLVYRPGRSYGLIFTLSLTALFLYLGVIMLPALKITLPSLDLERSVSLWNGLVVMFERGEFVIGLIMVFTLIIIPPLMLIFIAVVTGAYLNNQPLEKVGIFLESYYHLKEWNMAEIYLLAILISLIKLRSMGEIELLPGLYFLFAFLSIFLLINNWFNPMDYWIRGCRK